jgi:hypothetical protein
MAAIVSLRDVIDEMEIMSDEATSYINRKTGELITLTHEELALAEDPDDAEEAAEWQKDILPKAREVATSGDFIALPGKFEIHEWSIMERFARSITDAAVNDELQAAVHGGGLFAASKTPCTGAELPMSGIAFATPRWKRSPSSFSKHRGSSFAVNHGKNEQSLCGMPPSRWCLAASGTLTSRNSRWILQPIWICLAASS